MTQDMVTYTKAYQELEEAILIALDDAYSDGVDMDEAFAEIKDYVNESGCGDQTKCWRLSMQIGKRIMTSVMEFFKAVFDALMNGASGQGR